MWRMKATVLYNPKCGTCRKVRELLEAQGYALTLVEYLRVPPSPAELDSICEKLGIQPQELAREKEAEYAPVAASAKTRAQWLQALHDHPALIQRPIVIIGNKAIIPRPPEVLHDFLKN